MVSLTSSRGQAMLALIIGFAILMGISFGGGLIALHSTNSSQENPKKLVVISTTAPNQKGSDQIYSVPFVTITPTPTPAPPTPTPIPRPTSPPVSIPPIPTGNPPITPGGSGFCSHGTQMNGQCKCDIPQGNTIVHCQEGPGNSCPTGTFYTGQPSDPSNPYTKGCVSPPNASDASDVQNSTIAQQPNCSEWCIAKPVIYLYPLRPQRVDVSVSTVGSIVVSDPHYPSEGWKDILAHPDGTLSYQEKNYRELFYESSVTTVQEPIAGVVFATSEMSKYLYTLTYQLGLNQKEQDEFVMFWSPRLEALHSPYIFFSILDSSEKESKDHVEITPKPDTFISFIAYFKPLTQAITAKQYLLLPQRPERKGFTAVEWGGTIDYQK